MRRRVSEGTRPRLPWASRPPAFQRDPTPVLTPLERLKDDPALYVRRSVANNLNDIGKDHPDVLAATANAWQRDATATERRWIVQHALRSAVKRGEPGALATMGSGASANVVIGQPSITPQRVLVNFAVHYVKANGQSRAKVFKLKTLDLAARENQRVGKSISLADMTTRKHYPGTHRVGAILNGRAQASGNFELDAGCSVAVGAGACAVVAPERRCDRLAPEV